MAREAGVFVQLAQNVQVEGKGRIVGSEVAKFRFDTLLSLLPGNQNPALLTTHHTDGEEEGETVELLHAVLHRFIAQDEGGLLRGPRAVQPDWCVAVALPPHSVECLVALLHTMCHACALPVSPTHTAPELAAEIKTCQACLVLLGAEGTENATEAARLAGVPVIVLQSTKQRNGLFRVLPSESEAEGLAPVLPRPRARHDVALILHTSGSTGAKKRVPYTVENLVVGALCIAKSRGLLDRVLEGPLQCLSVLPLFHIAGISRNLAPLLLGGCVFVAQKFEPKLFWHVLRTRNVNYYAATPTMNQALLHARGMLRIPLGKHKVNIIESVGGALVPSLAREIAECFCAAVVQGYAMTECMPVTCPPPHNPLGKPGSVGLPVGPELVIFDEHNKQCKAGVDGQIMIRGSPLFLGYEGETDSQSFQAGGWFGTGDLGHLDKDGFLFITGRSKEVINRAGETLSPFEIENAVRGHECIKEVMAFSVPHSLYQETVGLAIVHHEDMPVLDLRELHKYLDSRLHSTKWPQLLVFMDGLPKSATNKVLRVGFAKRASLQQLHRSTPMKDCLFRAEAPPQGAPIKAPIRTTPLETRTNEVEMAINDVTGVTGTLAVRQSLKGEDTLVCFVTPASISGESILQELTNNKVDFYLFPDIIMPVESLPNSAQFATLEDLPGMKAVRQAAQLGTDSLGFLRERSDTYEMDTKVRNNCYVLFIMGMIIDHAYRCYPSLLRWEKKCTTIYFAQKWVQQCIYVIGGTKCVTGMLILAAFFNAKRGPQLQMYDGAIVALYFMYRFVYGWPFFWVLGDDCHPFDRFCHPRWFLACLIYARLIIAGVDALRGRLPKPQQYLSDYLLHAIAALLLLATLTWRDYHRFDMCDLRYYSKAWCSFATQIFYQKQQYQHGVMLMWPELAGYLAIYIFWFKYGQSVYNLVQSVYGTLGEEWFKTYHNHLTATAVGFYLLVSFLYTGHSFDNVHFLEVYERKQNFLEFDKWCVLRLADIFMYNLLALAGIAIAALVPFHLKEMGTNALGVYVCQFVYIAVMRTDNGLVHTMEYVQSHDVYGKGFIAGVFQLILCYCYQLGAWMAFGHLATEYVMLPAKVLRYIGTAMHELRLRRAFNSISRESWRGGVYEMDTFSHTNQDEGEDAGYQDM